MIKTVILTGKRLAFHGLKPFYLMGLAVVSFCTAFVVGVGIVVLLFYWWMKRLLEKSAAKPSNPARSDTLIRSPTHLTGFVMIQTRITVI